jgi:hypothetical protein
VRGERARVEVRQGPETAHRTELYVTPVRPEERPGVSAALRARVAQLATRFPGLAVEEAGATLHVAIPDRFRSGHEAHFAEVTGRFLQYLKEPRALPAWEKANMMAKYLVTTAGTDLSRR